MRICVVAAVGIGLAAAAPLANHTLSSPTAAGWQAYVTATEARITREREQTLTGSAAVDRGEVIIERVSTKGPSGDLEVPDATVNHWRGLVLIPGARLDDVLSHLESEPPDTRQQDIVASAVLDKRPGWLKVSMRVHRSLVLSAIFDTEHEMTFERHSATRASGQSTATKIVELDNPGTPREREKRPEEDRGLLWRWNAYWRYQQVERGLLVECESLTLSRPVPMLLKPIVHPLVSGLAKESMEQTLVTLRKRFAAPAARIGF